MKKILILCILLTVSSRAQQVTTIVPIGEPFFESGTYLKDVDNTFLPFIGTWEGIFNNKKYTINLIKFTQHLHNTGTGKYYFRDVIKGGLKVQDLTTNIILYDNLFSTIYDDLQPSEYVERSLGNWVEIQSVINSETIRKIIVI